MDQGQRVRKARPNSLIFSVTYEGQGTEKVKIGGVNVQAPKPSYLKIPVTITR